MYNNFSFDNYEKDSEQNFDEEIKNIALGESGVGKSNIIIRYSGGQFDPNSIPNSTASFIIKYLTFGNKIYRLNIWDTAGQEKYHSLTKIFIKDSNIVLLVYAVNDYQTFKQLDFWYKTIKEACSNIIIGVLGNKIDLLQEVVVDEEEARKKAKEFNGKFTYTSALNDDTGIDENIEILVKDYIRSNGESIENISLKNFKKLGKDKIIDKKNSCC